MTAAHRLLSIGSIASLLLTLTSVCAAQNSQPVRSGEPAQTPAETLHTSTELVVLDVVVEDRDGNPYHGLTKDDFVVTEQKKPQTVLNFEEHRAASTQRPGVEFPKLPPGIFTDYSPVAPDSTLNVLLIDTLNTPMKDQVFVRQQLLDYVKHEKPGTQVAVFGLASRIYMLQGFTSDPAILQAAVEHKLNARGSPLLDDPVGGGGGPESMSDMMEDSGSSDPNFAETLANVQQFEAETESFQTRLRTQYTLDAFNALAHYLSNFPGRKNLIWFSGSFPLNVEPDPTLNDPFAVMEDSNEEFRETTNLLTRSEIAVYPVDARGLMTAPMFDAANAGNSYVRNPKAFGRDMMKFDQSQAQEHMTMEQMASDTGGQAYYNTNGLSSAVSKAINAGSNYYTLSYEPSDHRWNGAYRNIHVALAGTPATYGLRLSYRHGYYADNPDQPAKHGELPTHVPPTAQALADHASEAYSRAAISHGAPAPSDILFKVRAIPLDGKDQETLAEGNRADPAGKMKPPYLTYAIDYVALPNEFGLTPQTDGRHKGEIEFTAFVFDADGNVLNIADKEVTLNLPPDVYKRFMSSPVRFQLQVSAPVKQESYMRLMIRDVPNNRYGVVEIPTAEVRHLPALEAETAPARGAKTGAAAGAAQPATKQ
ncbi:MAG TPA: VWA domain-containing protein [Candidatus Aquilonibacter sp.]|nr:VWA domain-containing protein [Candidatus Aquilonibacter sp.]